MEVAGLKVINSRIYKVCQYIVDIGGTYKASPRDAHHLKQKMDHVKDLFSLFIRNPTCQNKDWQYTPEFVSLSKKEVFALALL